MTELTWVRICDLADIPRQGARVVPAAGGDIAVFRCRDDSVFAVRDICPHKQGPLSEGIVHGHGVTCPLHGWVINLENGEAEAPDVGCAPKISVRVTEGSVFLGVAL